MAKPPGGLPVFLPSLRILLGLRWFIGVCMLVAITPTALQAKITLEEARERLARAQTLCETRKEAGQAFHLRAEVRVAGEGGEFEDGIYEEYWVSPRQWRREIRFPSYWGIEIAKGDSIARKRSAPIVPGKIDKLVSMMLYPGSWTKQEAKAEKASECGAPSSTLSCIKLEGEHSIATSYKFDAATGAVLGTETNGSMKLYARLEPFCEALSPASFKAYKKDFLEVSAEVKTREPLSIVADSLFEFPKDAEVWSWCPDAEPPKVESTAKPQYPAAAAMSGKQGRVVVGVIVDEAGKIKTVGVKESAGKDFDAAALGAVRHWSFKPAHCGDKAIPAEHFVTINFTMR